LKEPTQLDLKFVSLYTKTNSLKMADHHCIQILQLRVFFTSALKNKLEHTPTSLSTLQALKD